jgi:hypothetical protein
VLLLFNVYADSIFCIKPWPFEAFFNSNSGIRAFYLKTFRSPPLCHSDTVISLIDDGELQRSKHMQPKRHAWEIRASLVESLKTVSRANVLLLSSMSHLAEILSALME